MNFIGSHIPGKASCDCKETLKDFDDSEAIVKLVTQQIMRELGK